MKQTTYYLIRGRILGREDAGDEGTEYFLFLNGAWERDKRYVILGYLLDASPVIVESRLLFPLGFPYPGFTSGDYFPLAPHLGWYCLGIVLGRTLYREKKTLFPKVNEKSDPIRFFSFCGRNSLYIFILHLPAVGGIMMLLALLLH